MAACPSARSHSTTAPARARRRTVRLVRRLCGAVVLAAPSAWVLGTDAARRLPRIVAFDRLHLYGYVATAAGSALFWGVLLYAAARRRGVLSRAVGALFVVLFLFAVGVEAAFHAIWNVYLGMDGVIHSKSLLWSTVGTLPLGRPAVFLNLALAGALAVIFLKASRAIVRPRPWPRTVALLLVPGLLVAATQLPVSYRHVQSTVPDLIYFHAQTAIVKEHLGLTHDSPDLRVQRRDPEPVPPLSARPARPRNVLLILAESQRADVTCVAYDPACPLATPDSNDAAPERMPLLQMRANGSTTAISISNIWSGVRPTESRARLHSAPLLWEYARAAGYDTAYWTSQNLMFGNARLYVQDIPVSFFAVATHLDPEADLDTGAHDALLTDRVVEQWSGLKEPFFAVVHYSAVHFPYVYDEDHAPFQPSELDKAPEKNDAFKNYYKNVVHLSDMAVARLLRYVRSTDAGARTVVVFTSDHGESFREHWQLGHTSSVYEEEIRVPTWIDAPAGTLAPQEESSIRAARDQLVWHLDLAPTFLDLLGVWNDPALLPYRARMMGHPLTRPERTVEPVPLTNCTWVWECSFRNWGMMQGPFKVEAREWDGELHCFNVLDDPNELTNLGERGCGALPSLTRALYHVMPNVTPPGRPLVHWGK